MVNAQGNRAAYLMHRLCTSLTPPNHPRKSADRLDAARGSAILRRSQAATKKSPF
jgi:hypothetical protein